MTDKNQNEKAELGAEALDGVAGGSVGKVVDGVKKAVPYVKKGVEVGKKLMGDGKKDGGGAGQPDGGGAQPDGGGNVQTNTNHSKGVQMVNDSGNNNAGGINM